MTIDRRPKADKGRAAFPEREASQAALATQCEPAVKGGKIC